MSTFMLALRQLIACSTALRKGYKEVPSFYGSPKLGFNFCSPYGLAHRQKLDKVSTQLHFFFKFYIHLFHPPCGFSLTPLSRKYDSSHCGTVYTQIINQREIVLVQFLESPYKRFLVAL